MHTGNDQRRIEEAKQRRANGRKAAGHQVAYREGHAIADHAAERANKGMSEEHRQQQGTDRHDHQIEVIRHPFFKARFNEPQRQTGQQGRNNLCLITHFGDAKQPEIPDFRHLGAEQVSIHQLRGDEGHAQHDPKDRRAAHFTYRRPADAHRQIEENRLANQPQEVVDGFEAGVHLRQRLAVTHRQIANDVTEAQDQTAADQRRQEGEEDLGKV